MRVAGELTMLERAPLRGRVPAAVSVVIPCLNEADNI